MNRKLPLYLAGLLAGIILTGVALAQVSPNFDLSWFVFSAGGGERQSAHYLLQDTLDSGAGGTSSSANVRIDAGFVSGIGAQATPTPTATATPEFTATPTATFTPSPTAKPADTFTPSVTATPAATFTPSATVTSTPPGGDVYEDDDACARASTISSSGTPQTHTFHKSGDQDWVKFTAVAGKSYVLETSNANSPRTDTILFLYDHCDAPPLSSEDNAFASTVHLEWNATLNGTYYLKLQQHDPAIYGTDVHYDLSVTVDSVPPSAPHNLRAAPANQALVIQWQRSLEPDVAGYHVWVGTASHIYSRVEDVQPAGPDTTYYELSQLTNGTQYYLALSTYDFSGNESGKSLEISAIPTQPPDRSVPSVSVNRPSATDTYTTTQNAVTVGGIAQDPGGNLSRVQVRNITRATEGWDYSLNSGSANFHVENLGLNPGNNQIQVTVFDDAGNFSNTLLTIRRLGAAQGAVIIMAGHNDANSLQVNINNAANRAYRVFHGAGYDDDSIYYLNGTPQDPNGDGISNEVDAPATLDNLRTAIQTWAQGRVGPGKPLFLYLMDHGEIEFFCSDGCGNAGRITPADLNSWLNNLESATGADEINILIEACHSGSFIDRAASVTQSISKQGRVVITSTGRDNNAYASAEGAYFSDAFFSCLAASGDLKACYSQAKAAIEITGNNQTPLLDDNGDGLSNAGDGSYAVSRYVARFFGALAPHIREASVTIAGSNGVLTARVERGDEPVHLVWAAVYPPSFREPTVTTLDLGVGLVLLEPDPLAPEVYRANYPGGFTESGQYRVVFYAQDKSDTHAQPKLVTAGQFQIFLPNALRRGSK
ncbi:MAG: hypothetical protein EXR62_06145 [Chloroflexi bacterium]|nr:hypothetical protein [Chloroflexota bacterium]